MKLYRFLTGADDDRFCARVERLLNEGWSLHGPPTLGFDGERARAGQAITREVDGDYAGFVHLDELHRPDRDLGTGRRRPEPNPSKESPK